MKDNRAIPTYKAYAKDATGCPLEKDGINRDPNKPRPGSAHSSKMAYKKVADRYMDNRLYNMKQGRLSWFSKTLDGDKRWRGKRIYQDSKRKNDHYVCGLHGKFSPHPCNQKQPAKDSKKEHRESKQQKNIKGTSIMKVLNGPFVFGAIQKTEGRKKHGR
jgi:hypothetical protein